MSEEAWRNTPIDLKRSVAIRSLHYAMHSLPQSSPGNNIISISSIHNHDTRSSKGRNFSSPELILNLDTTNYLLSVPKPGAKYPVMKKHVKSCFKL